MRRKCDSYSRSDFSNNLNFIIIHNGVLGLDSRNVDTALRSWPSRGLCTDSGRRTPLFWAAGRGDKALVATLLR